MRLILATAIAIATPVLANAAGTNFEGEFVQHCLPTVTCSFNITDQGRGQYLVEWRATDRTGQRTYCELSAVMKRGPVEMRPDEGFEEAISTKLPGGDKLLVADMGDEGFMWSDGSPCRKRVDGGYIGVNGFYDRFYHDE